jgi:hypothetical protein
VLCVCCVCVCERDLLRMAQAHAQLVRFESHAKPPICKVGCCGDKSCSVSRYSSQNVCRVVAMQGAHFGPQLVAVQT